jgi:hypothetical protein
MKRKILSLMTLVGLSVGMNAQNAWVNDSVSMAAGSGNDVYYSMPGGTVKSENNTNWHLAFSMNAGDSSSIWANHNTGNAYVKVYNIHKDGSQWANVLLDDTLTGTPCFNWDQKYSQGALNDIPSADPFNFGWGTYSQVTHSVYGDSIFIVKANNVFYKVLIDSLKSTTMTYTVRVGDIVANTTNSYTIAKGAKYANAIFAHFNLATGMDTLREPDNATWDIVFNKYNSLVLLGPPPAIPYSVVGAFGNRGIQFGKAVMVHVDSACNNYGTYTNPWLNSISTIGYDWKSFTPPGGPWVIPDSLSYFIKSKDNNIYQLQFTGYSGSGSGNIYFRKRIITPTKVGDVYSAISQYSVFPNPAQSTLNVMIDATESNDAAINVMDLTGKIVLSSQVKIQNGINAFTVPVQGLSNGHYMLYVNGKNMQIKEKIVVSK